ncbi:MAG: sulfate ABC transporter permease subunit CysT [Planctomycetota bacterium]|nr:sulfate ABC transporter permease subunit CysT [Planctomycetota bacterium]
MKRPTAVLPGFGLTFGFAVFYLGVMVLLPLACLALVSAEAGWEKFRATLAEPRVAASFRLSFGAAALAAAVAAICGLPVAWALTRYRFVGQRLCDALIDIPFALPTAISGIALTALYAPQGWLGSILAWFGIKAAYTPLGVVIALIFVGFPFVVRSLQPVLEDLEPEIEEAAACLGASGWQIFWRVILPEIAPAWLAGATMALARGLGEYGSVIFIAGNLPLRTEIAPLVIAIKLEQFDREGASAIALAMLFLTFAVLALAGRLQQWAGRRIDL